MIGERGESIVHDQGLRLRIEQGNPEPCLNFRVILNHFEQLYRGQNGSAKVMRGCLRTVNF